MFLRRSVYAINRSALATNLTRSSVRAYATSIGSAYTNYETHNEIEVGDLVTYVESGSRTEGIVQKIFEESSNTNIRKPPHLAQVQNYYTRKVSYNDLSNLKSVARQNKEAAAKAAAATKSATLNKTAPTPSSSTTQKTTSSSSSPSSSSASSSFRPTATTTASTQAQTSQNSSAEAKDKINQQLKSEDSPLNADFATGDIVRYRVAQNFTAGVILDIVYTNTHDEHGNFHGASKENPMAKLENLWTKNITYHHLNVLEHVKRARDVTPGRFAESEFEVYNKKASSS